MPHRTTSTVIIWDRFVRLFHWGLALLLVSAWVTIHMGMENAHAIIGYSVTGLLLARVVWGFIGSRHARFGDFVYRPTTILSYLKEIMIGQPQRYLGHNPAGGAMVIALLLTLLVMNLSGFVILATIEFEGPMVDMLHGLSDSSAYSWLTIHATTMNLIWGLVALHLLGVIAASWQHRENLPRAMVSGYKNH